MKSLLFICSCFLLLPLAAQYRVSGKIIDANSGEPLAYASVVDGDNQRRGTLSNLDGSFTLKVARPETKLIFSYIGYQTASRSAGQLSRDAVIRLQSESVTLAEVEVLGNTEILYDAINLARQRLQKTRNHQGKMFFQLTTTTAGEPVELVQNYYQGYVEQARINRLRLKNGRIAITGKDSITFVNLSTSRAIASIDLLRAGRFAGQPLQFSKAQVKRKFELQARPDFTSENLLHFSFSPFLTDDPLFEGEMWIDKETYGLRKLILRQKDLKKHPFTALRINDQIGSIDIEAAYTFQEIEGEVVIDHIQMDYRVEMIENIDSPQPYARFYDCQGILHFYEPGGVFHPPLSVIPTRAFDYERVSLFPYDSIFWATNQGLVFTEEQLEQQAYLEETGLLINYAPGQSRQGQQIRVIPWADNKLFFAKETPVTKTGEFMDLDTKQPVKLFVHLHEEAGQIRTRSVAYIDQLAIDLAVPRSDRYFEVFNLYFDLGEIARRDFERKVAGKKLKYTQLDGYYRQALKKLDHTQRKFINAMERDNDELTRLQKWRAKIAKELAKD